MSTPFLHSPQKSIFIGNATGILPMLPKTAIESQKVHTRAVGFAALFFVLVLLSRISISQGNRGTDAAVSLHVPRTALADGPAAATSPPFCLVKPYKKPCCKTHCPCMDFRPPISYPLFPYPLIHSPIHFINCSISSGLAICSFIPAFLLATMSSANALAVMAIIGIREASSRSSLRIAFVAS